MGGQSTSGADEMSPELDTVLPGNDGQIWKELVELHGDDPGMFNTTKDVTVKHVVQALKVKIWQAARLITLWRKKVWREILTEWVATGLGYETFNLSTFSWMAALRLDEIMLRPIRSTLAIMRRFPADVVKSFRQSDWQKLAESGDDGIALLNVQSLMKTAKEDGDVLAAVMVHVVEWLNPNQHNPTAEVNRQGSNKRQLREYVSGAVKEYLPKCYGEWEGRRDDWKEKMVREGCRVIEEAVIAVALRHLAFFKQKEGKATLDKHSAGTHLLDDARYCDLSYYGERFQYKAWNELQEIVDDLFNPHSPLRWRRDRVTVARVQSDERITATAKKLSSMVCTAEWVASSRVLNTVAASQALATEVQDLLRSWAIRLQHRAGQPYEYVGGDSAAEMLQRERRGQSLFDKLQVLWEGVGLDETGREELQHQAQSVARDSA